jgi:hypothetical protein
MDADVNRRTQSLAARLFAGATVATIGALVPLTLEDAAIDAATYGLGRIRRIGPALERALDRIRGRGRAVLNRVQHLADEAVERVRQLRQERLRAKIPGYERGTLHEQKIAEELTLRGTKIDELRGENIGGPDLVIDGRYWEIKEVTGTGIRTLQTVINGLKRQFDQESARALGLTRADTRAFIDVRSSPLNPSTGSTWNNPDRIRTELDRLARNGGLDNVAEIEILTSFGTVKWIRP